MAFLDSCGRGSRGRAAKAALAQGPTGLRAVLPVQTVGDVGPGRVEGIDDLGARKAARPGLCICSRWLHRRSYWRTTRPPRQGPARPTSAYTQRHTNTQTHWYADKRIRRHVHSPTLSCHSTQAPNNTVSHNHVVGDDVLQQEGEGMRERMGLQRPEGAACNTTRCSESLTRTARSRPQTLTIHAPSIISTTWRCNLKQFDFDVEPCKNSLDTPCSSPLPVKPSS